MPSPALNRVPAPEALDDEIEALVARIVAKPRVAIALGKALFYRQLEQGLVVARKQHDEVVGVSLTLSGKQPEHAAVRTRWSGRRAAFRVPKSA
jgi:enoyl-CoA hydratase/carnithine racemase